MLNILVIGGTKYVGLELINLLKKNNLNFLVASRTKINVEKFIFIDKKNPTDLASLFENNDFDVVIDFINYSGLDSLNLYNALVCKKKIPKLILISSIYAYCMPLDLKFNSVFFENDFNAINESVNLLDRPSVTYQQGKRNMETFFAKNYG